MTDELTPGRNTEPLTLESLARRLDAMEGAHVDALRASEDAAFARRMVERIDDAMLDIEEEAGDQLPAFAKRVAVRLRDMEAAEASYKAARANFWWWLRIGGLILAANVVGVWLTKG